MLMVRTSPTLIALGGLVLAVAPNGPAAAQQQFYAGFAVSGGYIFDQDVDEGNLEAELEYDVPTLGVAATFGYRPLTNIRLELETSYTYASGQATFFVNGVEVDEDAFEAATGDDFSFDTDIYRATGSILLDLWPLDTVAPYFGVGLGYAYVSNHFDAFADEAQNVVTVHGEFGLPFALTPNIEFVPAARLEYFATDDQNDADGTNAANLTQAQLRLGFRYNF